jgi:hypothetical protein
MKISKKADISSTRDYWDSIAENYHVAINITLDDFHYGPLVPGDSKLKLLPETSKDLNVWNLVVEQHRIAYF